MSSTKDSGDLFSQVPAGNRYQGEPPKDESVEIEEEVMHDWAERPEVRRVMTLGTAEGIS